MPKTKTISLTLAALGVGAAIAGCGSSSVAPGVQQAPGAGLTADTSTVASASTSSTTTSSATTSSDVKLPAAFNTKPKVVPPSGPPPTKLVVKDLIKGTGPAATASSTVTVQYVGILYKGGKQFDASWNDGQGKPVSFPLSGVIKGWEQGIPGMRVGGRRELIIPPSLAYGSTAQAKIPANSTLVFVIDLHSIS